MLGRIGPKNDVTVLLMPHFSDRMREERFLIYDEVRKKAGVHIRGMRWYLLVPLRYRSYMTEFQRPGELN